MDSNCDAGKKQRMEPPHEEANTNRNMRQGIILIVSSMAWTTGRKELTQLYYYILCIEEPTDIKEEIFFKKEWAPLLFPEQPFPYFKRPTEKASKN